MEFKEQFLYHIWDAQHLIDNLETVSGKELEIMYQGRWNNDSGPDFKEAIIRIGDHVQRGDVEIHVNSHDWDYHNHSENNEFNNTILHAVYKHDLPYQYTIKENGEKLEIIELRNILNEDVKKLLKKYSVTDSERSEKYCEFFGGLDPDTLSELLNTLGKERLEKKIRRLNTELYFSDYNQLLYQGIMESLGYSKNKFQMLQLAHQLPYARLKEYQYLGMSKDKLVALLICGSGLIDRIPGTFSKDLSEKLNIIFSKSGFKDFRFKIDWKLFRIRPVNHPAVRILQIADLIYNSLDTSFFYKMIQLFSFPKNSFDQKQFRLNYFKMFETNNIDLPKNLQMGENRKNGIMINVILPLAILYARNMDFTDFEVAALQVFKEYPGLSANYITNELITYMTSAQSRLINKKASYQQGLLNLYYGFCLHRNCRACKGFRDKQISEM